VRWVVVFLACGALACTPSGTVRARTAAASAVADAWDAMTTDRPSHRALSRRYARKTFRFHRQMTQHLEALAVELASLSHHGAGGGSGNRAGANGSGRSASC